jgi:hypothetical protein
MSPRPKKAIQVKSTVNSRIITFSDVKGIVHKEFVPTGQNVNSGFYCDCVKMREDIAPNFGENRPGCFTMKTPRLILPSSPSSFWRKNKMAVIPHPPNSPDLAPCEFFLFPKMKLKLKGRRFDTTEEIQTESWSA